MNNKQFLKEVETLTNLYKEYNLHSTWRNKRAWKKQDRLVNRMIKQAAKSQADIVYRQTVELYQDIVQSNLG